MALLTATPLAARYGVHPRTAKRWIADAVAGRDGSYPVRRVEVVTGTGKREPAWALDVPDVDAAQAA